MGRARPQELPPVSPEPYDIAVGSWLVGCQLFVIRTDRTFLQSRAIYSIAHPRLIRTYPAAACWERV
jgi:hypothetical protein